MPYPLLMTDETPLPGEDLLVALDKLRQRLTKSGVERTVGLRDAMGDDCPYYWKSMNVFLRRDYKELRDLIKEAHELFLKCEEEDCGKERPR